MRCRLVVAKHPEDRGAKLNWQEAPVGLGEFLPAPDRYQSPQFEHHGRRYCRQCCNW